jgi:hypothetical protein
MFPNPDHGNLGPDDAIFPVPREHNLTKSLTRYAEIHQVFPIDDIRYDAIEDFSWLAYEQNSPLEQGVDVPGWRSHFIRLGHGGENERLHDIAEMHTQLMLIDGEKLVLASSASTSENA